MIRFVADNTVGKLRRWMGLLGYDVVYDPRSCREILADPRIEQEGRIVLGRCPTLARRQTHGERFLHVDSEVLEEQIAQITRAFPRDFSSVLFTRCSHCNEPLDGPLAIEEVLDRVPEKVRGWRAEYFQCPKCGNVYWEGTHTERIRKRLEKIWGEEMRSNEER